MAAADFVWDMTHFQGWPEQQIYEGAEGADRFLRDWISAWEDWDLHVQELHDAGDRVVAVVHQRGRSRSTGIVADMWLAMVWTFVNGEQTQMEMYSDAGEALKAVGLEE
jgi:ketosteroid isomerase-like protein